ncbi:MAG: monovalent cation/H(+) antiporter subunit G [Pseudomonadota bacterium]
MMFLDVALDVIGGICLVLGGFFCLVGALGLNRMPDVFTRMHATSVSDTLGVGLLVVGMATQTDDWLVWVRLGIIVIVLYVTGAVASHALARAALHDGNKPLLAGDDGELRETACDEVYPDLGVRIATPLMSETAEGVADVPPDASLERGGS